MSFLKNAISAGAHHIRNGVADYESWSQVMIGEFSPEIEPHLKEIRKWSKRMSICSSSHRRWYKRLMI